ncbi:hypothetical protein [Bradyrhizobium sp. USDA 3650]
MNMAVQLISEKKGWHWLITWDNPDPADSSSMIAALSGLGRVQTVYAKTTMVLAPRKGSTWQKIRAAIEGNLSSSKPYFGKAIYANLRSGRCFECVMVRKKRWKRVK